jgi:hypothetical protein
MSSGEAGPIVNSHSWSAAETQFGSGGLPSGAIRRARGEAGLIVNSHGWPGWPHGLQQEPNSGLANMYET